MRPFVHVLVLFASACGANSEITRTGDAPPDHPVSDALRACASAGSASVNNTAEVVTQLNALPRPVTVPCFIASLPRPLSLVATSTMTSVQPAAGPHDPRLFILMQGIVIALVSSGEASRLIELGEWVSATRTLKSEIELPLTETLDGKTPFDRVRRSFDESICGACHHGERSSEAVAGGFESAAYRPRDTTQPRLGALKAEHDACTASGEASARCDFFHALFDFGVVTQGAFASVVEAFGS